MERVCGSAGSSGYWKRRRNGYKRTRLEVVTLGSRSNSTQKKKLFCWRVSIKGKLRLLCFRTSKKLLTRFRDAYVKLMLNISRSRVFASGYGNEGDRSVGYLFSKASVKYDEKRIIELYKSMVAAQG
ncbi:hypothetical protein ACHQM5_026372 [Ranunculus cassubicifolius]